MRERRDVSGLGRERRRRYEERGVIGCEWDGDGVWYLKSRGTTSSTDPMIPREVDLDCAVWSGSSSGQVSPVRNAGRIVTRKWALDLVGGGRSGGLDGRW